MATEIERKFLVKQGAWQPKAVATRICQGYLLSSKERVVRVRTKGNRAFLTIKGANNGIVREEFEYEIPVKDAELLLQRFCDQPLLEKLRYQEKHCGHAWEIDVFSGANEGLIVAEVELKAENENLELPAWAGEEVSTDSRYFNVNLIKNPYCCWK